MVMLYLIEILHQTTTLRSFLNFPDSLYLIEILHQTTTLLAASLPAVWLYLIEILHQTTTTLRSVAMEAELYLIEILHQTTTPDSQGLHFRRCILSKFYIKPQLSSSSDICFAVVSYRNSTSNHNSHSVKAYSITVVSYRNSTSNHNVGPHIDW